MKKYVSLISAAALGLSLLIPNFAAEAWGPMSIQTDNTDLSDGGVSNVSIELPEGQGWNGFDFTISYPENKLSKIDINTGSIYENAYTKTIKESAGKTKVMAMYADAIADAGDILTVSFEAAEGAQGSAVISIEGECTKPDLSSEGFGQVITISLPVTDNSGSVTTTSAPEETAKATRKPSGSTGSGSGSASEAEVTATPLPTLPPVTPTATPSPTPAPTDEPLKDVSFTDIDGHWAAASIIRLAQKGYINGFDDNTFRPEENVTRAQFIKMLAEVRSLNSSLSTQVFDDVPESAWYAPYVAAAAMNGIVKGDTANNFNPDLQITRQEMSVMCARAFSISGGAADFADADEIADWASDAVRALADKKIITGFEDNTFRPLNNTTRAQASVVLERLMDNAS